MPPNTDEWREALEAELVARQPDIQMYEDYYDGEHRILEYATAKFKESFGDLFEGFATNWCGLVVDVCCERLEIQGFRFGEDEADDEAWAIWQENSMDARALMAHTTAVKARTSYIMTAPPRLPGGQPIITVEHPSQMITAHDPADRRIVVAALKSYRDLDGRVIQVVYEPETITTYIRDDRIERTAAELEVLGVYLPTRGLSDAWDSKTVKENPLGEVMVTPLENSPHELTGGSSDLDPAIRLNDAANKFFTDMIVASEYISFPQRVLTGVELPRDPVTGEVVDDAQLKASYNRVWAFEAPDASVSELSVGPLTNYVEGVDLAVQHIAAQTRTPPHYLLAKLANLAADALKAAETGLNFRCKRKHKDFSDTWETVMRQCFKWRSILRVGWVGSDEDAYRATLTDAQTIWMDPESKDPINETQALTNLQTIGVPQPILWRKSGMTPQEIKEALKLRAVEDERTIRLAQAQAGAAGGTPPGTPAQAVSGPENGPDGGLSGGPSVSLQDTAQGLVVSGLPAPPETAPQNGGQPKEQQPA